MKNLILALTALITLSSAFASNSNNCRTTNFRDYEACAKEITKDGNTITLTNPTLHSYDLKPKEIFRQEICKFFGGTYLSHKSHLYTKTTGVAITWNEDVQDIVVEAPWGGGYMRSKVMTRLICTLNP